MSPPPGTRSQIIEDFYNKLDALQREKTSRDKYGVKNENIKIGELEDMLKTEREMAKKRSQFKGTYDEDKRRRLTLQLENMAKRWVRNPDGTYKEYRVNWKRK